MEQTAQATETMRAEVGLRDEFASELLWRLARRLCADHPAKLASRTSDDSSAAESTCPACQQPAPCGARRLAELALGVATTVRSRRSGAARSGCAGPRAGAVPQASTVEP